MLNDYQCCDNPLKGVADKQGVDTCLNCKGQTRFGENGEVVVVREPWTAGPLMPTEGTSMKTGDEIIGKTEFYPEAKYPSWALRVSSVSDDVLRAAPLGGGFVKVIPMAEAKRRFRLVTDEEKAEGRRWKQAKFQIEDGPTFSGYHIGDNWNGWACPSFEKAEADKVLEASKEGWAEARFDAEKDAYIFRGEGYSEEESDIWTGDDILIDGKIRHVYSIGAYCWIWSEAE